MWTQELAVDAVFQATGETEAAAEQAPYGVVRLLHDLYIPVKRTLPHQLEPFFITQWRMIVFRTAAEAEAFVKLQEEQEASDAE